MDEVETKTCLNCKREIPAVNFTIHSLHCARNIKICPVCKEPVPHAELQEHHEKLHKLLPCKKCGESVCGTDLEDHVRDSCAHTIKSCRFCELELPRREIPAHENYCGVRTEQCGDCREWVMLKYRQLHVDSNHGFIRLDDEPAPQPKKELPKLTRIPKPINKPPPTGWKTLAELTAGAEGNNGCLMNNNFDRPRTEIRRFRPSTGAEPIASGSGLGAVGGAGAGGGGGEGSSQAEGQRLPVKRTNDQPQINTNVAATDKVNKDLNISRGAVKKRPAPKPPAVPKPDPRRDHAYYSAMQRQQDEERQRLEQSAINLARGLPPVLSAAAKLERLRKMDALHNRETEPDYTSQGPSRMQQPEEPTRRLHSSPEERNSVPDRRNEFSNLKPMSPDEFMRRFNGLQMENCRSRAARAQPAQRCDNDRFSEIKSSLRELRRGLNEVTAPYNANPVNNDSAPERNNGDRSSSSSSSSSSESDAEFGLVRLPCEFCDRPVVLHDLVRHQTGCRPDLAQIKAPRHKHRHQETLVEGELQLQQPLQQQQELIQHEQLLGAAAEVSGEYEEMNDLPVIPCEFCTESLPVYLISEHQERCRRDGPMMYLD